jgi:glucokinase
VPQHEQFGVLGGYDRPSRISQPQTRTKIAELAPDDLETLNPGAAVPSGTMAVISAGTGLGEAGLLTDGAGVRVISSEGGHTDFGPRSELEVELYQYLAVEDSHVSYERVCSGMGLLNIYRFLRRRSRILEPPWLTAEIAARDAAGLPLREASTPRLTSRGATETAACLIR